MTGLGIGDAAIVPSRGVTWIVVFAAKITHPMWKPEPIFTAGCIILVNAQPKATITLGEKLPVS